MTIHTARYSTRLNSDDRCVEVYDTQAAIGASDVMAAFYWDEGNAGQDATALADELNYTDAKRAGEEAEKALAAVEVEECTINCPGCPWCEMGEAVYCEACANELDPADAVLSGDEMVCCDCADKREIADEGLRLAGEDQPGWTMRLRSGAVVWVTDEPPPVAVWPCEIRGGMVVRRVNWGS